MSDHLEHACPTCGSLTCPGNYASAKCWKIPGNVTVSPMRPSNESCERCAAWLLPCLDCAYKSRIPEAIEIVEEWASIDNSRRHAVCDGLILKADQVGIVRQRPFCLAKEVLEIAPSLASRLKAAEETIRNMRYALIDATEQNAKGLDDDWDLVREAFALANKYLGEGT